MKVSASEPFQLIYSLFQHEYLGYIFEAFIVRLDEKGKLTYQHQNISSKNAREFARGLDDRDFELIDWMDGMNQDSVLRHFSKKIMKPDEFFHRCTQGQGEKGCSRTKSRPTWKTSGSHPESSAGNAEWQRRRAYVAQA
jgi:hypothetical protein